MPRAGHDPLRLRPQGRPAAPGALARALRPPRRSPASSALVAAGDARGRLRHLARACRIDYASADDRAALAAKVDQLVDLGVAAGRAAARRHPGAARARAGPRRAHRPGCTTTWTAGPARPDPDRVRRHPSTPYLDALAAGAARRRADRLDRADGRVRRDHRRPTPRPGPTRSAAGRRCSGTTTRSTTCLMADRLFLGPLRGREPGLARRVLRLPRQPDGAAARLEAARWPRSPATLRGDDPEAAWAADVGALRTFAEACDGERPWELVDAAVGGRRPLGGRSTRWRRGCDGALVRGPRARGRGRARGSTRCTPRPGSGSTAVKLLRATRRRAAGRGVASCAWRWPAPGRRCAAARCR